MAAKTIRFLTSKQVQRLHGIWISASAQPSQPHLLESAINSPMSVKYYTNQDNVFQLAANLSEKIMKNHAYQDGNKRTALLAADMFLKINGYRLQKVPLHEDQVNQDLANAHVAVVTNQWTAEQLGSYYQSVATPIDEWTPDIVEFRNMSTEY
ncbi:hypothetical protein FQN54_008988 [Arachnomyces sp. PD_36]|nr:hypothetical protein FQN54_008988 [Arachnomyces sp. PD_36]